MKEKATAYDYLLWFYQNADLGPADGDVRRRMEKQFVRDFGADIPDGFGCSDDEGSGAV